MTESIKPLAAWPGCEISDDGRVWKNGVPKAISIAPNGYKVVQFWKDRKNHTFYVHRLVLEAFVGPCPDGCEALHRDGDRTNSRVDNLRWGTRKENVADAIRHGTATIGARNSQAKFNEAEVLSIKRLRSKGVSAKDIAERFGVCTATVINAVSGRTYQGVSE